MIYVKEKVNNEEDEIIKGIEVNQVMRMSAFINSRLKINKK
jgi:hypothetical protein